jgi:hypothetical protein
MASSASPISCSVFASVFEDSRLFYAEISNWLGRWLK